MQLLDKFFAANASLWRKQYVHFALSALSWTSFTTPDLLPVRDAAPSARIPARFSQEI